MERNSKEDVRNLEKSTNKILCDVSSIFPFHLFPDRVIVDQNKIDIIYKHFFWSKRVFTILHEDLTTAKVTAGPLFANIQFEVRGYETNPEPITFLSKSDAFRLHSTLMGIGKALKNSIPIGTMKNVSQKKLRNIGKVNEDLHSAI